jgi:hypothetical protein
MNKQITYNNLYKNVSFGLYEIDDINFEYTKEQVLTEFKNRYESIIKDKLKSIGVKLIGFNYYSPRYYNYENDNIDTIITVIDKDKLKKAIIKHKDIIQNVLDKNISYDGYIALTVNNIDEELNNMSKTDYEPDIIILRELLNIDLSEFNLDKYEYFYYKYDEEA